MKKISLKKTTSFRANIGLHGPFSFETGPLYAEIEQARENTTNTLCATTSIEHMLEETIQKYLFTQDTKKIEFFNKHILKTSFFTFATKKQIVLTIVQKNNLLQGNKLSDLQKNLKAIMNYRNALVHGEFVGIHNDNSVLLKYFDGKPTQVTLNDNYWENLETTFEKTYSLLEDIRSV